MGSSCNTMKAAYGVIGLCCPAVQELGYAPQMLLDQGLQRFCDWFLRCYNMWRCQSGLDGTCCWSELNVVEFYTHAISDDWLLLGRRYYSLDGDGSSSKPVAADWAYVPI